MSATVHAAVRPTTVDADGRPLSGLLAEPREAPRGVLLALHGGGYRAGYWDYPADPARSLFSVATSLGYAVLALDRPGYGASFGPANRTVEEQAASLLTAVGALPATHGLAAPVFAVGHSLGSMVALEMASLDKRRVLSGIALSGLPARYPQVAVDFIAALEVDGTHLPTFTRAQARGQFYGPESTFEAAMLAADDEIRAPVPEPEFVDARNCPAWFPGAAARVRVPVQYVYAEHEASSDGSPEVLAYARSAFTRAPHVEAIVQVGAGHNISRHKVARAHHLRIVAFTDDCLAV